MVPISPIIPGFEEIVYGAHQPKYNPLPVIRDIHGQVVSRWTFSDEERLAIAAGCDLFVCVATFNKRLQPIALKIYNKVDISTEDGTIILNDFNMSEIIK